MSGFTRTAATLALAASLGCATAKNPSPTTPPNSPGVGTTQPSQPTTISNQNPGTIPVGQEIDVRLRDSLSSETATVEQRFETTTAVDLMQGDRVLVPAGTVVRGVVSQVDKAGRVDRTGRLTLSFDQMVVRGREVPIRAMAAQVYESGGIKEEGGRAAVGAGVGGVVGGLIGGLTGVLVGAAVGAGGAIVATEGKDITLPAGTIIRIRLDSPAEVRGT